MTKIFFDRIIILEDVEKEINSISRSHEERDELWQIVDDMICHKVLGLCMSKLPQKHHKEFLDKFKEAPFDESLIDYLKEKIKEDVEALIKLEVGKLAFDIIKEIRGDDTVKQK